MDRDDARRNQSAAPTREALLETAIEKKRRLPRKPDLGNWNAYFDDQLFPSRTFRKCILAFLERVHLEAYRRNEVYLFDTRFRVASSPFSLGALKRQGSPRILQGENRVLVSVR